MLMEPRLQTSMLDPFNYSVRQSMMYILILALLKHSPPEHEFNAIGCPSKTTLVRKQCVAMGIRVHT